MQINADFWDLVKNRIKTQNKDNKVVETWLDPISFVDHQQEGQREKMVLGVPSPIHQYFVSENLMDKIYSEIRSFIQHDFEVDLKITGARAAPQQPSLSDAIHKADGQHYSQKPNVSTSGFPTAQSVNIRADHLNAEYTFSTFVVGRNNEFAHAACYNVALNPGSAEGYNPLVIYGPTGMGKTHLLHAVGNKIKETHPHLRINYVRAEDFLNQCVSAIRRQEMEKFRSKFRENHDVLMVDDVQMIGKTEAVQEEFFHTINTLLERRKQVVVASDRMPKDILGLDDRNRSRLEWGLIADITMPDFETRVSILKYKAESLNIRMPEDVITHIARIAKRSIRELEGNLRKIKIYSELQGLTIDIELARRVLANHETQSTISVEDIQKMVSDYFKIRTQDLKSTTRAKQIVVPRQICMHLIKKHLDKSLVDIGRAFGGKDHTTVMNALERVEHLQSQDLEIKKDIDELNTRIHNITGL